MRRRGLRASMERLEHVGQAVVVREEEDSGARSPSSGVKRLFFGNALRCCDGFSNECDGGQRRESEVGKVRRDARLSSSVARTRTRRAREHPAQS
jgi:hypothetical protein